eukprot:jgi/Antlo1/362/694
MDEKRNVIANKTYRVDMCFQWDRDAFDRAVDMLGKEQGHVGVEDVDAILRAMASLRTDTESAHMDDSRDIVKILWDRYTFGKAVQTHGEQLQSKVDAEEVEAVLHAMAYLSTGKVDIVYVSGYMEAVAKCSSGSYEIRCDAEIFDKTYNILVEREQEKVNADDMVEILHLMDYLLIQEEWEWACYDKLARKTKEDNKDAVVEYTEMLKEKVNAKCIKIQNFSLYTQHLLRLYAEEHGMHLTVDEERKTLDLWHSHIKKEQRENRTENWELRVEVSEEYRRQREVQRLAVVLMEVMDMTVEVDIEEWKPEDRGMVERIISKAKKTELRIKSGKIETGVIAQHMEMLKNNIVELDVSGNINISDEDWKTVGEMTGLKKLKMRDCNVEPGTITKHMQSLKNNLVELDILYNYHLSNEDWDTVGEMTRLERLNISHFNVEPGTTAQHIRKQKNSLVMLDVSCSKDLSDEDWKTVGEMTGLKKLKMRDCNVEPGTITKHMQSLKNNLVELDVSWNTNLSDEDWKTVGEMTGLKKLKMRDCNVKPGTITKHMKKLKNNLVGQDVSWNRNISDEDWKTVGEMTRLERLNISNCYIRAGTIAQHMQSLKNNLVELDVSWNRNISDEDWKTVGEMTRLERLNISNCYIRAGTIAQHMQSLNLVELDVSSSRNLSEEDWKTMGEMTSLKKLKMRDCNVKPGTITKHMQSLENNLMGLDVSYNRDLSDEDWKTVGEMTRLERLNISNCYIEAGTIAQHMQSLNLVELDVSCNYLSDEDWKTVGEMTGLKKLKMRDCNVEPGTITKHMQSLKNSLVKLDVSWNTNLSDEDWKTVGEITGLDGQDMISYGMYV